MKLLLVYHAGATAPTRYLYDALAARSGVELVTVVPLQLHVDRVYDPSGVVDADEGWGGDAYRLIGVPLHDPGRYWLGFEPGELRRVLRAEQPDVVHVLDEAHSGYLFQTARNALRVSRRSRIAFYAWSNLPPALGPRARLKWRLIWSRVAGGAAASSEALALVRRAGFPAGRPLRRIFWGIPTDLFRPGSSPQARDRLGLPDRPTVAFVGRLAEEKGLRVLLAAAERMPSRVQLLVVGAGPMRDELESLASGPLSGRLHLREPLTTAELARLLPAVDVLALPSLTTPVWKEQYGRVLAEAMASGVPVVGSSSGAIPEVIDEAGLVVPEGDAEALADACLRVLEDDSVASHLRDAGLRRAETELSVTTMAERLHELYAEVLD